MRLSAALKDKKMDVRLRDKSLSEGRITTQEVNEYFESLPDDSKNADYVDGPKQKQEE